MYYILFSHHGYCMFEDWFGYSTTNDFHSLHGLGNTIVMNIYVLLDSM